MRPVCLALAVSACILTLSFSAQAADPGSGAPAGAPSSPPAAGAAQPSEAAKTGADKQAAAPVQPPKPIVPTLVAKVDLTAQSMTVTENGHHLYTWRVSSGRDGFPTPKGTFRAEWVAKMWYSRQYDMAPMPYSVFFKNGAAIHGTSATSQLGNPASHGCVRLTENNAATFFKLVNKHGLAYTRIIVQGNPPIDRIARRRHGDEDEVASLRQRDRDYRRYGYNAQGRDDDDDDDAPRVRYSRRSENWTPWGFQTYRW